MRAVVFNRGADPRFGDFDDPRQDAGTEVTTVRAAALTNLDVAIASGRHYFSPDSGHGVVGREAVVLDRAGVRRYLNPLAIPSPFGSMAERAPADLSLSYLVPDGVSDEVAAAIGNAGLAAWLPLSWRAKMRASEKVLVLGATGTSGRIAVAAAQLLGAGRVVAAGRNGQALAQLEAAGADAIVRLDSGDDLTLAYCEAARGKFDVVLDFLNGPPAEAALGAMATGGRMVQIGSGLAPALALHAQTARRSSLDVLGFAYYHAPILEQAAAYSELCSAFLSGRFPLDVRARPLEEFAAAWEAQRGGSRTRQVLVP